MIVGVLVCLSGSLCSGVVVMSSYRMIPKLYTVTQQWCQKKMNTMFVVIATSLKTVIVLMIVIIIIAITFCFHYNCNYLLLLYYYCYSPIEITYCQHRKDCSNVSRFPVPYNREFLIIKTYVRKKSPSFCIVFMLLRNINKCFMSLPISASPIAVSTFSNFLAVEKSHRCTVSIDSPFAFSVTTTFALCMYMRFV